MKLKNKEIYVNNLKLSFLNFFSISLMRISRFYYKSDSTKNKQTNKQTKMRCSFQLYHTMKLSSKLYLNLCLRKWLKFNFNNVVFSFQRAISTLVAKFACANLAAKLSAVNLLNSCVVINLPWSWSSILFSISKILVL